MKRSPRQWWQAASPAAKLRQVRGAIDIGLTRRETAILLGTTRACVGAFAANNGVRFADDVRSSSRPDPEPVASGEPIGLDIELSRTGAW